MASQTGRGVRQDPRLRRSTEIQGNVLAAFNKDFQAFLLLNFPERRRRVRAWLGELCDQVAVTAAVEDFNIRFSVARSAQAGVDPRHLSACWATVAFTASGLRLLLAAPEARLGRDLGRHEAFLDGAAKRAASLGDRGTSSPDRWVFGGPATARVDAILTVAADREEDLRRRVGELLHRAACHGVRAIYRQDGRTLPGDRAGHEHFGFKDGISQPGVKDFHEEDPSLPGTRLGHPGEKLIQPGEFVLGHEDEDGAGRGVADWLRDGSFQVLRRLEQDVPGFWAEVDRVSQAAGLKGRELAAAKLMGRWRSGTPLSQAPARDNAALHHYRHRNDFDYRNDPDGTATPRFSHVRKMYLRQGTADDRHRIMRRGIPYGDAFDPTAGRGHGSDAERGLVFNAYCADITRQFEHLQRLQANNRDFPAAGDGPDAVIGHAAGSSCCLRQVRRGDCMVNPIRHVQTRGTVYAFTPSLSSLKNLAAGRA